MATSESGRQIPDMAANIANIEEAWRNMKKHRVDGLQVWDFYEIGIDWMSLCHRSVDEIKEGCQGKPPIQESVRNGSKTDPTK